MKTLTFLATNKEGDVWLQISQDMPSQFIIDELNRLLNEGYVFKSIKAGA